MPIELIQKQTTQKRTIQLVQFKSWTAVFAGALVLTLICYGGLFGYKKYLARTIERLDSEIVEIAQQRDFALEEKVQDLDRKINNIGIIFKNHLYWSKIFPIIENLTLSQIYYLDFDAKIDSKNVGVLTLEAKTVNYSEAAEEMQLFKDEQFLDNVTVESMDLGEEGIEFSIEAEFNVNDLKDL